MSSRQPYLILLAEGGREDSRLLYSGPLADGVLEVGRSTAADIVMPADESAIGQHHCNIRIEAGVVWLDPLPHQEVFVDAEQAPAKDIQPLHQPVRLLPPVVTDGRIVELGLHARTVQRPGRASSSWLRRWKGADNRGRSAVLRDGSRTRLRIMLSPVRAPPVITDQQKASKRHQEAERRGASLVQIVTSVVSLLTLGILVLGGPPAYAKISALLTGVDEIKVELAEQQTRMKEYYEGTIGALERQHQRELELLAAMPDSLKKIVRSQPAKFEKNRKAVWLAGNYNSDTGAFHASGTAWVLEGTGPDGRRSVITNKHVRDLLISNSEHGAPAIRRQKSATEAETVMIDAGALAAPTAVHPQFADFLRISQQKAATAAAVNVFDVARLVLAQGETADLGEGLTVATSEDLRKLAARSADWPPVGYIGFPYENLTAGGANTEAPEPVYIRGEISAMSDPFRLPSDSWQDLQLILVDATATGGASGSPVFNDEGNVIGILSGGDVVHIDRSVLKGGSADNEHSTFRMPSGFAFVIRSEVVSEVVSQQAKPRTDSWNAALERVGAEAVAEREELARWRTMNCRKDKPARDQLAGPLRLDADGRFIQRLDIGDKPGASYYFSARAIGEQGRLGDIDILVGDKEKLAEQQDDPGYLQLSEYRTVGRETNVRLIVTGTPGAALAVEKYECAAGAAP